MSDLGLQTRLRVAAVTRQVSVSDEDREFLREGMLVQYPHLAREIERFGPEAVQAAVHLLPHMDAAERSAGTLRAFLVSQLRLREEPRPWPVIVSRNEAVPAVTPTDLFTDCLLDSPNAPALLAHAA